MMRPHQHLRDERKEDVYKINFEEKKKLRTEKSR